MLTSADFAQFYEAVHSEGQTVRHPFRWQNRLASRVCLEGWGEEAIALPTACGKTSVIDIAVFALALQAQRLETRRTAPLRTFFVVDRRLVVDDAYDHAKKLAKALAHAERPILREVADALLSFGCPIPLDTAVLRGGMYRSDLWADAPNQPLVCVSTVDQVGSRLLFRGYGCSEERRPIDAGLVGCDSLILLDEAHLSQPFLDTVRQIRHYAAWGTERVSIPMKMVEMSATSRNKQRFGLIEEDYADEALAARLNAVKLAELREVADLKLEAVEAAKLLARQEQNKVIGIVVNTVDLARSIFTALGPEAILLTGRVRPYDRDKTLAEYLPLMRPKRDRGQGQRLFVVATQTIEVGADLDFDALITESAPLDALRQRFGRLDRLGDLGTTHALILRKKQKSAVDWVYGEASQATWDWLKLHGTKNGSRVEIDFGVRKMQELYEGHAEPGINSKAGHGPLLFPAHVETWVQTNPTPLPDPDVAPFLHGADSKPADVNIVWRADLEGDVQTWVDVMEKAAPSMREALPVPYLAAKRWLKSGSSGAVSDIEGTAEQDTVETASVGRPYLVWRGIDKSDGMRKEFFPGDTVVVRSQDGGADRFGWNAGSKAHVDDIGDDCANERAKQGAGRYRIRVHPEVLFGQDSTRKSALAQLIKLQKSDDSDPDEDELWELVASAVNPEILEHVGKSKQWYSDAGFVVTSAWQRPVRPRVDSDMEDSDSDDTSSLTVKKTLRYHTNGVWMKAKQYAAGCGVDPKLAACIELAAQLHDLGKCDERFQMLLSLKPSVSGEPMAKGDFTDYRRRVRLSGYPPGARHEFWSVKLIEKSRVLSTSPDAELVKYLVGVHHGRGRPFVPVWQEDGTSVSAEWEGERLTADDVGTLWTIGAGWVDLFWALTGRYGFWGLAYLEAILRRADCVQSREEQIT